MEQAMSMPGGGTWLIQSGQVTDDSELSICLMNGLLAGNGKFDPFHIAMYYGYWIHSDHFSVGRTTMNGLGPLEECRENPRP